MTIQHNQRKACFAPRSKFDERRSSSTPRSANAIERKKDEPERILSASDTRRSVENVGKNERHGNSGVALRLLSVLCSEQDVNFALTLDSFRSGSQKRRLASPGDPGANRPDLTMMKMEQGLLSRYHCGNSASKMPWGDIYGGPEESSSEAMTPGCTFHANPSRPAISR